MPNNLLLGVLTLLVMAGVAYAYLREGMFTAFTMTVNVFLAGLVAFNFFEPIAGGLEPSFRGGSLQGTEDAICLVALFSLTLAPLRWATNSLARTDIHYHPQLLRGGGVFFGLVTGYLVCGFLLCVLQTLPWDRNFLGFEAKLEPEGSPLRQVLPPDRVWLGLMQRASEYPLQTVSRSDPYLFDPDGSFELRYERSRRDPPQPYPPKPPPKPADDKGAPSGQGP